MAEALSASLLFSSKVVVVGVCVLFLALLGDVLGFWYLCHFFCSLDLFFVEKYTSEQVDSSV